MTCVLEATGGSFSLRLALTLPERLRGLIGRAPAWLGPQGALVIAPCRSIHTLHLRRAIDVAFIDAQGRVLLSREGVPPNRVLSCPRAHAVMERFTPTELPGLAEGSEASVPKWPPKGSTLTLSFTRECAVVRKALPVVLAGTCRALINSK